MSVEATYLQIKKAALRSPQPSLPTDGLVHPGQSYHVDIPAPDRENILVQVLHIKMPLTHELCEGIGAFQKSYGLDTETTAQLIISLGIIQLRKLMDSPLAEPPAESE